MGFCGSSSEGIFASRRLEARDQVYRREIPGHTVSVMAGQGPQWNAAKDLSAEMMRRFDLVLADTPTMRERRGPSTSQEPPGLSMVW